MTNLTSTRSVDVTSIRTIASMIAIGLLVILSIALAVAFRPAGALAPVTTTVVQAPVRDDYALRQPTTATGADDYGLRHSTPAIVATTSRMDDYSFRHPSSAAGASQSEDRSDFGLRHPVWIISESR